MSLIFVFHFSHFKICQEGRHNLAQITKQLKQLQLFESYQEKQIQSQLAS